MRPKVALFGDSITEDSFTNGGWGAALANHFSRTADVVLRGYSGYNTRWALKVAARAFDGVCSDGERPLALTVFFGANDASIPDRSSGFQHVPLDEYQSNLRSIISFFKERWPTTVIVLITPPPIDEDGRLRNPFGENPSGLPERTNESAGAYAKACIAVATESNIPVIDMWSKMQQFPSWEKSFLSDGLHFTASGNKILFEEVVEKLKESGFSPDALPVDLPLLSEIDPKDPLKAFEN
ncbi:GDSL esterase/lipase At5g45920 [Phalaenopsis equestris]|uniref:GDSL esterase/lipase At5g45920 n=1 Tax=Phalaenopsis equestris TaxID=78828 RepID=UPI0009E516D0|nr:GDSL esterase/lipase At5g45920 [Phalaenopsis equestris]